MPKKATLRDIARQADVALSTVSQVLNNKPGVSPEMRQRVLKTASDLGYRQKIEIDSPVVPMLNAVGLLTKRYNGDPLMVNPFYSYIIAGAENECQRHNLNLMYANIEVDECNRALSLPPMLLDERVDGVMIVGTFLEETIFDISRRAGRRSVVLVDAYTSGETNFDSVVIDSIGGSMRAISYLVEMGHRHIGLIGSNPESYPSVLERRQGYLLALQQHGLEPHIEDSPLLRPDAFQATLRLMKRVPEITAIFACNDNVAIGVMNALKHMGLNIPGDVSIVGFDDIDLAQEVEPPLTTIHVDKVLMGATALRHLLDRSEDPNRPALKTLVTTQLIIRNSVRNLL